LAVSLISRSKTAFDPYIAKDQLDTLLEFWKVFGPEKFCRIFISIVGKANQNNPRISKRVANKRLVPFRYNRMQRDMEANFKNYNITLKMRQGGSTTWHVLRRIFLPTILEPGTFSVIVGQTHTYTRQYFAIANRALRYFAREGALGELDIDAKMFHQHLLHTRYSAKRELVFDYLDSQIHTDSAENEEVGQGLPGVSHLHCPEVSRWEGQPEETMANLTESVVPGGTVDIECTANKMGGYFFQEWMRAKEWPRATYRGHFYPWWWADEYAFPLTAPEAKEIEESITDQEAEMRKLVKLSFNQIAWRRFTMGKLRHNFPEKYPEDDMSAFIMTEGIFFDRISLAHMKRTYPATIKPIAVHHDGDYVVYKRRIPGRNYLLAMDVIEGKEITTGTMDFDAGTVIDIQTGEEMASYSSQQAPEDCADEAIDIAKSYNNAMIVGERNGPGGSFHLQLRHRGYMNVYKHKEWFKEKKSATSPQVLEVIGFPTNTKTRPIACNLLAQTIRDTPEQWKDIRFVDEALVFTRDKKGVPRASENQKDDRVLCRAIACYVRHVLLGYLDPLHVESQHYGDITGFGDDEDES
jgi:hypothetical protein